MSTSQCMTGHGCQVYTLLVGEEHIGNVECGEQRASQCMSSSMKICNITKGSFLTN